MAGLTKYARDKLAAELQSGAINSGPATIKLGDAPDAYVKAGFKWPTQGAPEDGLIHDPETGKSWRIRFNKDTQKWDVLDEAE